MEALRLLLAAVLLPAQFLVAGPAAANDPLVFRAQQKLTNLSSPAETGRCIGRSAVFGAAGTGDGRTIEDQG